ncbi:conserved hypothetical protein [Gloeothece citriformis PCC 7424]|uniref:ADP-ribosylation/Crystallin J1 n=1 Tax=Gloeothece citriformis (strain PCC 7424) TaxID=65393 RepID=B7KCW7_GLOC7|nr:hypothetical protein [Gloeothece citriformis]ACK73088.1 conserved hypothetical protein [Gloeothece citriformis PCC 7424]
MKVSLLSRFQGGLLGAWIGASSVEQNPKFTQADEQLLPWIKLGIEITEGIINSGQILDNHGLEIFEQYKNKQGLKNPISSGMIAISTLPLALFFHDSPHHFKQYLYSLNDGGKLSQETLEEVIIWQDALSLILREKVDSSPLIPQLLKRHSQGKTALLQQLEQMQLFLEQKIPLHQVLVQLSRRHQLQPHEIALACYCFSYSPQEFSVCIKRAKTLDYQPFLTATLTGILVGVYNGISGIPIAWRGELWDVRISQNIYRQATNLLAVWSGVDQPSSLQPLQQSAIASPLIIQPRPTVKMISQTEI